MHASFRPVTWFDGIAAREAVSVLWKLLINDLDNFSIAEISFGDKEALASRCVVLDSQNVSLGDIPNVDPEVVACWTELLFGGAGDEVANADV
jgi:hypothetical protein